MKGGCMDRIERVRGVIGTPARGDKFWDREKELTQIWKALETSSVLLVAPRRFGKTSIMLKIMDKPKTGWKTLYLDTEWIEGPGDFIVELITRVAEKGLLEKVWEGIQRIVGGAVSRIETVGIAEFKISLREKMGKDWRDKGRELLKTLKSMDDRLILITDELPILIHRINRISKKADEFLFWLRGVRLMPELLDKVRWIIGGSIGMRKVLKDVGVGTEVINDLRTINIREYPIEAAREHIRVLLKNEGNFEDVSDRLVEKFLKIIEVPIPFFIQILVREALNKMEQQGKGELSEEIIEKAYEDGVLAPYNRTYFDHYYERLEKYYGEEEARISKRLLMEVARKGEVAKSEFFKIFQMETKGKGTEETLSDLLTELENDFYIVLNKEGDVYRFSTKVLRDWWLRFHTF